jgi:hypothetical protein
MQYRALDRTLQRLKETQRLRFDPARFEAVAARLSSGAEEFVALAARARRASDTLLRALRCATLALRVARRLPWP